MDKRNYENIEGMEDLKRHPFFKHAVYRRDKVLFTPCLSYCSLERWNDEYLTFTERFKKKYADPYGYIMDDLDRIRPGPDTKTVDFG